MNIIITGPRHCGKTTVIKKIIKGFNGSISGFVSEFNDRASNTRELYVRNISGTLSRCAVRWNNGPHELFPEVFEDFAADLIDTKSDLIIIDELGKFEKNCSRLKNAVDFSICSSCPVIVCIRLDADGWMQELKGRSDVMVITVTEENRDSLPGDILNLISNSCKKR